jgi:eukaryotic-like serine/threonine-protein kinase
MDRWDEIEDTYHAARDLRGDARVRFLDERCGSDNAKRQQVQALLVQDETPNSLFDRPAIELAAAFAPLADLTTLTGRRIGAYQVLEPIGSGAMGEVYRARDATLNRDVALKILPPVFMVDPDRRERFRHEAQVLASLNHPNIAAIYGFEESNGLQALVLELVEGGTLADRVAQEPIPVDDALSIAGQVAEALEAAHEQNIVHRDLKPANVKVRPDGTVKVLDFGLAKALGPAASAGGHATKPPAMTSPLSHAGVLVGTAAYMSPEQARGEPADKRSDVWAFGCVLYEMLTGRRAFGGEDVNDTLTMVLRGTPAWTAWPDTLPPRIRALVEACLAKNRRDRIADISTARFVMKECTAALTTALPPQAAIAPRHWKLAAFIAATGMVAAFMGWSLRPSDDKAPAVITRFSIALGEDQRLQGRPSLTISPDGSQFIYAVNLHLYLRSMSELEGRPIAGIESDPVTSPVFSPDGRSIAFWSGSDRALKRVAASGGRAVTICQADGPMGITWGTEGIVFGQADHGIMRVSADGGTPEVLVSIKPGEAAFAPQLLPEGRGTLFTVTSGAFFDKPRVVVQAMDGARKTLIEPASDGRYLPTGHIVYAVEGRLMAVSFDLRHLQVTSAPVPVIEGVARTALTATGRVTGLAQWSVSTTGSLVYIPGPPDDPSFLYRLAVLDRTGKSELLQLQAGAYESPRFSPDGRYIAFGTNDSKNVDIWIHDLRGVSAVRRLTFGGRNRFPIWSPDGRYVAFQSDRDGDLAIFARRSDSSGTAERLTKPDAGTSHIPESWSARDDVLSFSVEKDSRFSLWTLSVRDKRAMPFAAIESEIPAASVFSPDGRWIAYQTGRKSVADVRPTAFVQPFPATGTMHQIPNSGAAPVWSADGRELFYTAGPRQWVAARVTLQPSFVIGNPVRLPSADLQVWRPDWWRQYDISRDGRRIGLIPADKSLIPGNTRVIQVVLNWFEELKQRLPVK